ncbi:hypothetical protein ACFZCL_37480 [Streptomyces sp. NPDC008159]|uniref:hypothetical protein n=1 Tax=Streptomyces sp. NPDC008159 TaxID=3364817 RepID=UPI0036E5D5A1
MVGSLCAGEVKGGGERDVLAVPGGGDTVDVGPEQGAEAGACHVRVRLLTLRVGTARSPVRVEEVHQTEPENAPAVPGRVRLPRSPKAVVVASRASPP